MENKIKSLIVKIKEENETLSEKINSGMLSEYSHAAAVHTYNTNLSFISQLQIILS